MASKNKKEGITININVNTNSEPKRKGIIGWIINLFKWI